MNSEHQEAGVLPGYADSLDELQEIGARIIRHGAEMVRFRLAD